MLDNWVDLDVKSKGKNLSETCASLRVDKFDIDQTILMLSLSFEFLNVYTYVIQIPVTFSAFLQNLRRNKMKGEQDGLPNFPARKVFALFPLRFC